MLVCGHFRNEIEIYQLKKSLKYFSILRAVKNNVRLEYVLCKMPDFVSFRLLGFALVIKLRNFDFESHSKYFDIF